MPRLLPPLLLLLCAAPAAAEPQPVPFPFKKGDRVAWVGSSSTAIGVWPKTMEFLLRTRHPGKNGGAETRGDGHTHNKTHIRLQASSTRRL